MCIELPLITYELSPGSNVSRQRNMQIEMNKAPNAAEITYLACSYECLEKITNEHAHEWFSLESEIVLVEIDVENVSDSHPV